MISPLVCLQEKVFSPDQVDELKKTIESLPRNNFFLENKNGRWGLLKEQPLSHRYVNPHNSWFAVSFGIGGEIMEEITLPFQEYQNYATIKKIVCVALKWMAEQMAWHGTTRQMSMSIMQHYHLQKGATAPGIPWHRDNSDKTVVILLDDESKWSGGNFLFKEGEREPLAFQPKRGYGVLFSNKDTRHCVEPWIATEEGVDRTILTIHEKAIR